MSHKYYYFVASLPYLDFGVRASITVEQFMTEARQFLAPKDYQVLLAAVGLTAGEDFKTGNRLVRDWMDFNQTLRNELTWFRATQANKDPSLYMHGERSGDPAIADVIAQMARASDPLTAERLVDRIRWQKLEELVTGHYFDWEVVLGYAIKLMMLERYQTIESPQGEDIYAGYKHAVTTALEGR